MPLQPAGPALRRQEDLEMKRGAGTPSPPGAAQAAEVAQPIQQSSTGSSRESLPCDSDRAEYYELLAPPAPPESTVCDRRGSDAAYDAVPALARHSPDIAPKAERGRQDTCSASSPGASKGPERPRSAKRKDENVGGSGRPGREVPRAHVCRADNDAQLITSERQAREALPLAERPIQAVHEPPGTAAKGMARPVEHCNGGIEKAASPVQLQPGAHLQYGAERGAQQQQQQQHADLQSPSGRRGLARPIDGQVRAAANGTAGLPHLPPPTRPSPRPPAAPAQVRHSQHTPAQ